jgi:hypothetical protein
VKNATAVIVATITIPTTAPMESLQFSGVAGSCNAEGVTVSAVKGRLTRLAGVCWDVLPGGWRFGEGGEVFDSVGVVEIMDVSPAGEDFGVADISDVVGVSDVRETVNAGEVAKVVDVVGVIDIVAELAGVVESVDVVDIMGVVELVELLVFEEVSVLSSGTKILTPTLS